IKRCLSDGKSHHFAATPQACCLRSLDRARPPTSVVQGFQTLRGDFVRDLIRLCGGVASHFAVPRPPTSAAHFAPRTRSRPAGSRSTRASAKLPVTPTAVTKESDIGREFSLEGMLESYTQRKNVTVNLTR